MQRRARAHKSSPKLAANVSLGPGHRPGGPYKFNAVGGSGVNGTGLGAGQNKDQTHGTNAMTYSANWAGAVLDGVDFQLVTGTFAVPTPRLPKDADANTEYAASAWVGIDGSSCQDTILQVGLDFSIQGTRVSYDGWYEWYPDYSYNFVNFAIRAGDIVRLTAASSSTTSGRVLVENLTTGQSVAHTFSGESSPLCQANAEWIVEDFMTGNSLKPMANFGTVTFTNCSVTQTSGTQLGVTGSTIINMQQNGNVMTNCSTSYGKTVSCTYT
ncbi:aspergillopepsin [Sporothrix brasiliensis 5110]|uniref:Aspergillopepsin n=1 Tax=Sporothrix brasiliensis 5110 TaxID=1398154 RepID=A0A0C2FCF2_9PEZI|nr:aspergillopepsin [Sporothrix brasiliensis 5110]KIH88803.1 aspergillopepsin [Sporothrix brasiliensis 5110]